MKIFNILLFSFLWMALAGCVMAADGTESVNQGSLESFFVNYFGNHDFKIIKSDMDFGRAKITLAVRYVDSKDSRQPIFNKGVAVEVNGAEVTPLLFFGNNVILGKDKKMLVDLRPFHHKCYGWLFRDIYREGFSINVAWIADESHLMTAQDPPISIEWNKKKKEFYEHIYPDE